MVEVIWIILQQNNRFLLVQQPLINCASGIWTFPGGKINPENTTTTTAYQKLKEKVGIQGKRFRKLSYIHLDKSNIQVFLCDQWNKESRPTCKDIIRIGWFTLAEMYALKQNLAPFVNDSLLYLSYLIQHYSNHPNEWKEQWEMM